MFTIVVNYVLMHTIKKCHGAESEKGQIHARENILWARGQNWEQPIT